MTTPNLLQEVHAFHIIKPKIFLLQQLAKKYKKDKDLVIAKMDATANDVPAGFEVSGFPTIYFATR